MLPRCPDCGLRPRYLVDGKWSTIDKINQARFDPGPIKIRPQHTRRCLSEYNRLRHFLRIHKIPSRARPTTP